MRVLIDTNVILDYVLERQPFHADAEKIVLLVAAEDFVGRPCRSGADNTAVLVLNR